MGKYDNIEEGGAIVDFILSRWKKGLLPVVKIYGAPGTGKSYATRRLMELLSEKIYGENVVSNECIVDNLLGILEFVRKKKPLRFLGIEEAQNIFPSRRAMSSENVSGNMIFDTLRKKGIIVIMNFPLNKTIDSHLDALCNISIETLALNKKEGVCVVKPMKLQVNYATSKVYHHRMIDKRGFEVHRSIFRLPNQETSAQYEEEKDEYLSTLYDRLHKKQEKKLEKENKSLGIAPKINRPLTKRELEVYDFRFGQGMKQSDIGKELGISRVRITQILKNIYKKGIHPPKIEEVVLQTA